MDLGNSNLGSATRWTAIAVSACMLWPGGAGASAPLTIAGKPVELSVQAVNESTVRITLVPLDDDGQPAPLPDSPALAPREWSEPAIRMRTDGKNATAELGPLRVSVDPRIEVRVDRGGQRVQQLQIDRESGRITFLAGPGPVLGLGQGGPQFDRRRTIYPMINDMHAWDMKHMGGRLPIPWLVGTDGWGLFIHEPWGVIHLWSKRRGWLVPQCGQALPIDLFVIAGKEPSEIMRAWAKLTGYPAMPPQWKMGYTQSHRGLSGPEAVMDSANKMRERRLPCDMLTFLGSGFVKSGWNTGHGSFAWNPTVFPEPAASLERLRAMNFRVCLHVWGAPAGLHGTVGQQPDSPVHAAAYWKKHANLAPQPDAWWPDGGEELPIDGRLARHRMYFEGQRQMRPDQRPYSLHRTGYTGMQRWGGWLWTGDPYSTWETLRQHVPIGINTGLSGIPFWGTDAGGFHPTQEYTGELYVRWFQFAAFCPEFRSHGITWHLHTPWGWNTGTQGPQEADSDGKIETEEADVAETNNPRVEPICRKFLELRYRLLPYNYTICRAACTTGMPMIRAMWLHYPGNEKVAALGDQYLWGREILVAPVTEKGAAERRVFLPPGRWYDFWTGAAVEGDGWVTREVDLSILPLYVRAGAVLPLAPVRQYTAEPAREPLEVVVHPGADGSFTMYEDDGCSYAFDDGDYCQTRFTWNDRAGQLTIEPAGGQRPTQYGTMTVRRVGEDSGRRIDYSGERMEVEL